MSESVNNNTKPRAFSRIVGFVVDKRKLFYLLCVILAAVCLFTAYNTEIADSLTAYVPDSMDSGMGYDIMTSEFTDLATAQVLLENVSQSQCEMVQENLSQIDGVYAVDFDAKNYQDGVGVLEVTFAYGESDEAMTALSAVKEAVAHFDGGVSGSQDTGWWWNIDFGMIFLFAAAVVILIIALIYASRTYADVWVMLITLVLAVIINYGTSFGMSKATSLTAGIFQAVITVYYTALICRRYTRERKDQDVRPAILTAVDSSMPKIMAGAVIATAACIALAFARFQIGFNFALAITKGVLITIILCITLLPCLITTLAKRMEKSRHKPLLPKVKNRGELTYKTRYAFPIIFAVLAIAALAFVIAYPVQPYAFGGDQLMPLVKSNGQMIEHKAYRDLDKDTVEVYMIVPGDNYDAEAAVIKEVENMVAVESVKALSNSKAASYMLTDKVNIWQFSDITGLDVTAVWNIYSDYGELVGVEDAGGIEAYEVPFIEIFNYTYNRVQEGSLTVESGISETLESIRYEMIGADLELWGEDYDRIIINAVMPEDPHKAVELMDRIKAVGEEHYEDTVYITGDNGAVSDMAKAYQRDTILVTAITVVLLIVLLAVMLKALGTAVILVLLVQGGVWLTMAVPYLFAGKFIHVGGMLSYTIQMIGGVTFAAAITNSYKKFKKDAPLKKAIGQALKENYTLIVVTGSLLILSGLVLGVLSFDKTAMAVGFMTAIGGAVNMLVALCVVPQTLLFLDIVESKITNTEIDVTGEVKISEEERMDIVEAIESLKAAEQRESDMISFEQQTEEQTEEAVDVEKLLEDTIIPEKEGEQTDETEK